MGRVVGRREGLSGGDVPDPASHWFEPIADHLGSAYLRYSFTKGTRQEVDHLVEALGLVPGSKVLDVGCGPGRHAHEFARRGVEVHGIDISQTFIDLAQQTAPESAEPYRPPSFERLDARDLIDVDRFAGRFDAVVCLCQGAFGLMTAAGDDERVVAGMARALVPGGRLALSAFNAYFAVRYHDEAEFDAATGVCHEVTEVRDPAGAGRRVHLWTGCYTPRELRQIVAGAGLHLERISSVEPGAYGAAEPTVESPEFLVIARRVG